jgi:hypothetical protein
MSRAVLRLRIHIMGPEVRTAAIPTMLMKRSSCPTGNMRLLTVSTLQLVSKNMVMDMKGMDMEDMESMKGMGDMEGMDMMESSWSAKLPWTKL